MKDVLDIELLHRTDSEQESELEEASTDELCEEEEDYIGQTFSSVQYFANKHPGCLLYIELNDFLLATSTKEPFLLTPNEIDDGNNNLRQYNNNFELMIFVKRS